MKPSLRSLAALSLLCGSAALHAAPGPVVTIYDSTQIAFDRYTVVKRVGIEGWESAFRIRGHASLEAARQALADEALRAGGDGLINLICFDQTDRIFKPVGYYCYGNAIKVKDVAK